MGLKYVAPPTKNKRVVYDWEAIYADLRANPGDWALLREDGTISTYNAVTQGKVKTFHPSMGIEMRTANNNFKVSPRTCDLYVRYNPDKDEGLTAKEVEAAWRLHRKNQKEKKMNVSTVESSD
jgi:hypothetical protein